MIQNRPMNVKEILNKHLYPSVMDNVRRKDYPYYDTITIASGTTDYYLFTQDVGNGFLRNKKLPLTGSEVFFIEEITAYIKEPFKTEALLDKLNELLQQSYLEVIVNNRVQAKIPGMDFLSYLPTQTLGTGGQNSTQELFVRRRKLPEPILMNSNSSFELKWTIPSTASVTLDTYPVIFNLNGLQLDKLQDFYWNELKRNMFQKIAVTYYDTVTIANGNESVYNFFQDGTKAKNLQSLVLPLSDIQTFSLQAVEVFVNQPDVPIEPYTIFQSRSQNVLRIVVDDVVYYDGNIVDLLSVVAGYTSNATTAGADTFPVERYMNKRQQKVFRIPLEIPANSKVQVTLAQQSGSVGITGEITLALRGVETRRVA